MAFHRIQRGEGTSLLRCKVRHRQGVGIRQPMVGHPHHAGGQGVGYPVAQLEGPAGFFKVLKGPLALPPKGEVEVFAQPCRSNGHLERVAAPSKVAETSRLPLQVAETSPGGPSIARGAPRAEERRQGGASPACLAFGRRGEGPTGADGYFLSCARVVLRRRPSRFLAGLLLRRAEPPRPCAGLEAEPALPRGRVS